MLNKMLISPVKNGVEGGCGGGFALMDSRAHGETDTVIT